MSAANSALSDAERIAALEAKCALLSASLKQADALRDKLVDALKDAQRYIYSHRVRANIGAALAKAGAA